MMNRKNDGIGSWEISFVVSGAFKRLSKNVHTVWTKREEQECTRKCQKCSECSEI